MICPTQKGATPTLLARRLGWAEVAPDWPSGQRMMPVPPDRKAGKHWAVSRRLGGLDGLARENKPKRVLNSRCRQRQSLAFVHPDGNSGVFSVVAFQDIGTAVRGLLPRLETNNRHR